MREPMPVVWLLAIIDCCLAAACLVLGLRALLRRRDRDHGKRHGRPEQQGRHRQERHEIGGVHRVSESVADIRQRERADDLRYYPNAT